MITFWQTCKFWLYTLIMASTIFVFFWGTASLISYLTPTTIEDLPIVPFYVETIWK